MPICSTRRARPTSRARRRRTSARRCGWISKLLQHVILRYTPSTAASPDPPPPQRSQSPSDTVSLVRQNCAAAVIRYSRRVAPRPASAILESRSRDLQHSESTMKRFPLHASTLAPLIIIAILLSFMPVHPAHAAAITVSTFDDELTTNGKCSLREAIANANDGGPTPTYPDCPAGSGADTIVLSAGSYVLSIPGPDEEQNQTGDLDIRSNMTIIGADLYATTIDGNAATTLDRVFHIHIGTNVRLSNMSIIKGSSSINGGGILNEHAMLTLYRVEIGINKAINNGGGIFNDGGTLTLSKSIIGGNSADGNGGGIANDAGTVAFVDSNTMNDNYAKANGGGIFNNHNLIVDGLWLHSNRAELSGGNIYSGDSVGLSSLTITNSEVRNGLANADGGGIYNDGGLSLT